MYAMTSARRPSRVSKSQRAKPSMRWRTACTAVILRPAVGLGFDRYPARRAFLDKRCESLDDLVAADRLLESDLVDHAVARIDEALERGAGPRRGVEEFAHCFFRRRFELFVCDHSRDEPVPFRLGRIEAATREQHVA